MAVPLPGLGGIDTIISWPWQLIKDNDPRKRVIKPMVIRR